ncbi:MAG: transglutaminase domain-containing protein [Clostridia bacterium]|nr:transglutaminase domain-containing protein [Clostridia bacterium]
MSKKILSFILLFSLILSNAPCVLADAQWHEEQGHLYQAGSLSAPNHDEISLFSANRNAAMNALSTAMLSLQPSVDISSYRITPSEIENLFSDTVNAHPEFFYIGNSYRYYINDSYVSSVQFTYLYAKEIILQKQALIAEEQQKILSALQPAMTPLEKALAVHDYFVLHYAYDYERYLNDTLPPSSFAIDGLFIDKTGVCQAYALGYMLIMQSLDIPCIFVPSYEMGHAWNMLQLGDSWYHIDVTYDDPVETELGFVSHQNFLCSDTGIMNTAHSAWESPYTATDTTYDSAFWKNLRGGLFYDTGYWYYLSGSMRSIEKRTIDGKPTTVLTDHFDFDTKITFYNDCIFYNKAHKVYSLKKDGTQRTIYSTLDENNGSIVGLVLQEQNLVLQQEDLSSFVQVPLAPSFSVTIHDDVLTILPTGYWPSSARLYLAFYGRNSELLLLESLMPQPSHVQNISVPTYGSPLFVRIMGLDGLTPFVDAKTVHIGG